MVLAVLEKPTLALIDIVIIGIWERGIIKYVDDLAYLDSYTIRLGPL